LKTYYEKRKKDNIKDWLVKNLPNLRNVLKGLKGDNSLC